MSTRIKLRVSETEQAALSQAARLAGMTVTDYVLARCLGDQPSGPAWCAVAPRDRHVEMLWQEGDVQRVDAAAAAHGMDRTGYVRARVWGTPAAPKPVRGQLVQRVTQTREVDRQDYAVDMSVTMRVVESHDDSIAVGDESDAVAMTFLPGDLRF